MEPSKKLHVPLLAMGALELYPPRWGHLLQPHAQRRAEARYGVCRGGTLARGRRLLQRLAKGNVESCIAVGFP